MTTRKIQKNIAGQNGSNNGPAKTLLSRGNDEYISKLSNLSNNSFEILYNKNLSSNSFFNKLFENTHLPIKILADVFELTPKTLNSYKSSEKIIPMHVRELSIKLNELYSLGNRIFGSPDNFNDWLKKASYGLGGIKPIELINTITGIELISDELVGIEYGTTA